MGSSIFRPITKYKWEVKSPAGKRPVDLGDPTKKARLTTDADMAT